MGREFTEEEARRIFARAAERQHSAPTPSNRLTLEELQEIGKAAGLEPEHVAAAVIEAQAKPPSVPSWQGVPLRASASRLLPGDVSEEAWMRIVDQMRAEYQVPGVVEREGRRRVWRQHEGSLHGASVSVTPEPSGSLMTVESARAPEDVVTYVLGALASMMGGIGLLAFVVKDKPDGLTLMIVMAVFALAVAAAASVSVRRRARVTPGRVDALLDRLAGQVLAAPPLAAGNEADAPEAQPEREAPVGRLDLDPLGTDADAASGADPLRQRTRA